MDTPDSTATANTLKGRAHQYARHTGVKYTAALALITAADDLARRTGMDTDAAVSTIASRDLHRASTHRWVLAEELRNWLHGDGWHGLWFDDLNGLIDQLPPRYECGWCGEVGDAQQEDSTVQFVVQAYDPDLSPQTHHLSTTVFHARCKPGGIAFAHPMLEEFEPCVLTLSSSTTPGLECDVVLTARPFLSADPDLPPVLFLTAAVDGDENMRASWLTEFEFVLRSHGFSAADSWPRESPPPWSLRVLGDGPRIGGNPWLALRTGPLSVGDTPGYLFVGEPARLRGDVDPGITLWAQRAYRVGEVLVVFGPTAAYNTVPALDLAALTAHQVDELLADNGYDEKHDLPLHFLARSVAVVDPADPTRLLPGADKLDEVHGAFGAQPTDVPERANVPGRI